MFKFGSTGITTGYIKQLLASFNLPKAVIYTREHERFAETHGCESPYLLETFPAGIYATSKNESILIDETEEKLRKLQVVGPSYTPYIKDGRIQFYVCGYYTGEQQGTDVNYFEFVPGKWQSAPFNLSESEGGAWQLYERGEYLPNLTKRFEIKNNVYDSYTHEYLGEYLRFLRDYDGIDLMPLYNCFSNNRPSLIKPLRIQDPENNLDIVLDTSDSNYKIYSLPVKLFQNYTIAIDSPHPIEICCGFCNKNIVSSKSETLIKQTYAKYNNSQFNRPFLYTNLMDLAIEALVTNATNEDFKKHFDQRSFLASVASTLQDLHMFIKVSSNVDSSIVVLEGDYCNWNDFAASFPKTPDGKRLPMHKNNNHTVIANESIFADIPLTLITPLQLLQLNTKVQMPFADRLLEYLLDQCVTGGDNEVRENVLMAQRLAGLRYTGKGVTRTITHEQSGTSIKVSPTVFKYDLYNGVWSEALRRIFYNYMSNQTDFSRTPDSLGYVDKDVENSFTAKVTDKDGTVLTKTMISFNAWEDIE